MNKEYNELNIKLICIIYLINTLKYDNSDAVKHGKVISISIQILLLFHLEY